MVYGAKAILPTELCYGSPKIRTYQPDAAKEAQKDAVNFLEESRDITIKRSIGY
jgi:hypothetical protein